MPYILTPLCLDVKMQIRGDNMIKIEDLRSYISNDKLNDIFLQKEEKLYNVEINDNKVNSEIFNINKVNTQKLEWAIRNIPDGFVETIKNLRKCIEEKLQSERDVGAYYNEKFYKVGFCDGLSLILECVNKEKLMLCEDTSDSSENKF